MPIRKDAKPKLTSDEIDAGYRLLTRGRNAALDAQRDFDETLEAAREAQRLRLAGIKPVEGSTLEARMNNAESAREKRVAS